MKQQPWYLLCNCKIDKKRSISYQFHRVFRIWLVLSGVDCTDQAIFAQTRMQLQYYEKKTSFTDQLVFRIEEAFNFGKLNFFTWVSDEVRLNGMLKRQINMSGQSPPPLRAFLSIHPPHIQRSIVLLYPVQWINLTLSNVQRDISQSANRESNTVNPLSSLWCCSDTMAKFDPPGHFGGS